MSSASSRTAIALTAALHTQQATARCRARGWGWPPVAASGCVRPKLRMGLAWHRRVCVATAEESQLGPVPKSHDRSGGAEERKGIFLHTPGAAEPVNTLHAGVSGMCLLAASPFSLSVSPVCAPCLPPVQLKQQVVSLDCHTVPVQDAYICLCVLLKIPTEHGACMARMEARLPSEPDGPCSA